MEVLVHRPEGARRSTTLIKAKYTVGNGERVKVINLAQLKKENPNAPVPPPDASTAVPPAASSPENLEQSSTTAASEGGTPTRTSESTVPVPPGTVQTTSTQASQSTASTGASRIPIATCHGTDWFEGGTDLPTNGPFTRKSWKLTCQYTGKEYTPLCDHDNKDIEAIEFFMAVFPSKQLSLMVEQASEKLRREGKAKLTKGELLKWFGVLLLITRFEFGDRSNLWQSKSHCKFIPAANFGERTGMTRDRFHEIFRSVVWSVQPPKRPEDMSCEAYRWLLIEDFVANFNEHRAQYFHPGWLVCVDESMSRWY
jgi:Transposase IS4